MIFASGTVPDMVSAPFWSTTSGEGKVIKKAAMEGQILDLTPYLDKYPNVKKLMTTGIAKDFAEFDLNSPEFEGKHYVTLHHQTHADSADRNEAEQRKG